MRQKKIALTFALLALTLLLGYALGKLDFFGFLTGAHALHFVYLLTSFIVWHLISTIVFLLDLEHSQHQSRVYLATSIIFGLVFWLFNQNWVATLLATLFFFGFLFFMEKAIRKRTQLFIKFSVVDMLFPVIRKGFIFLLIIIVGLSYLQSNLRAKQMEIVTPATVKFFSRPFVFLLNKQLGAQLQLRAGNLFEQALGTRERESIIEFVLNESLETMTEGKTRQLFGLNPNNIPLQKTIVYESGEIDLSPVVAAMIPEITRVINNRLQKHIAIVPLIFVLLVFIFISPILTIVELLLFPITYLLVSLLLSVGFIKIQTQTVEKEILSL